MTLIGTYLALFQNFPKFTKNVAKVENLLKIVKNELQFQSLKFLSYFNIQSLKRKNLSQRNQIQTKKYDLFEEKLKKI